MKKTINVDYSSMKGVVTASEQGRGYFQPGRFLERGEVFLFSGHSWNLSACRQRPPTDRLNAGSASADGPGIWKQ